MKRHRPPWLSAPIWRDYFELTKPKVVALMLLTVVIGMLVAEPGLPGLGVVFSATLNCPSVRVSGRYQSCGRP